MAVQRPSHTTANVSFLRNSLKMLMSQHMQLIKQYFFESYSAGMIRVFLLSTFEASNIRHYFLSIGFPLFWTVLLLAF
jgi:hypothetical protein